jgi:hypothetical protein
LIFCVQNEFWAFDADVLISTQSDPLGYLPYRWGGGGRWFKSTHPGFYFHGPLDSKSCRFQNIRNHLFFAYGHDVDAVAH